MVCKTIPHWLWASTDIYNYIRAFVKIERLENWCCMAWYHDENIIDFFSSILKLCKSTQSPSSGRVINWLDVLHMFLNSMYHEFLYLLSFRNCTLIWNKKYNYKAIDHNNYICFRNTCREVFHCREYKI